MARHQPCGTHLIALAAATLLVSFPTGATAQQECTDWTPWDPIHPLTVLWSWRMCDTMSDRYDIQWRFANSGQEEVEFEYDLFTGMVTSCGEDNRGRRFAGGKYRIAGGQWNDHYNGRKTLRTTGFQQRFWMYLCLRVPGELDGRMWVDPPSTGPVTGERTKLLRAERID